MKKILLLITAISSLFVGSTFAADFTSISCSDTKISANAASCSVCFNAGSLYYRSDSPIENITQFYDTFSVSGTGARIMWQDETTVAWNQINNKFTLGSSLAPNRDDANGFKFQLIPGSWQTAQNAPNTGRIYGYFPAGSTTTYVKSAGGISLNGVSSTATPADRNTAIWRIVNNAASHEYLGPGLQGPKVDHVQCAFVFPRWCGDGIRDTDKGEQCDDGNTTNGDGCSNICQPEVTSVCTGLTVTPTSVTNGGTITYTCTGNNVSSYSIIAKNPDGTTLASSTNASGSITLPATPTGTYSVACYVNNQVTTPAICQKTVTNTTSESVCTGLTLTPTSLTNGGTVSYSCNGNNVSSYSVVFRNPDNSILQTINASSGSVVIPSSLTGTYSASCFVNGQTTTPAVCTKTLTNSNNVTPTCDNLTVNVSDMTATYSCSGSNASSYRITLDGSQISTNSSGSTALSYGTHTFVCSVNGSITSASCQKTVTLNPNQPYPQIQVIKDDADNHDDQQQVNVGGAAQFTVTVRNPGQEPLDTVNLSDQLIPECNRSTGDTNNMIMNTGNRDGRLDPGESFSYICTRSNANQSMFPNNENRICVSGRGVTSGNNVNSCDITRIYFDTPSVCQNIQLTQNGNQVNATCSPNGGYRLFVLQGTKVVNTFQNPQGQFSFALNDGTYKVACLRDGEKNIQPACQQNITINPNQNVCIFSSSVRYGGAPLQTDLNCRSQTATQCTIEINKDGQPWKTLYDCSTTTVFDEKGYYEATCYLDGNREENCSTDVQVDIMTIIKTGPFLPILIVLAIGLAGYITYRRRKTA